MCVFVCVWMGRCEVLQEAGRGGGDGEQVCTKEKGVRLVFVISFSLSPVFTVESNRSS